MAERTKLQIAAGQKGGHRLEWGDPKLGPTGDLGSLQWSVIVLDELTVDLEVSARLSPPAEAGEEAATSLVLLQEVARGRTFRGTFDPAADERLTDALAAGRVVEAIVFDLNNEFSWFAAKEVELVVLRERPQGPPLSQVPALLPFSPLEALPRGGGRSLCGAGGSGPAPGLAAPPEKSASAQTGMGSTSRFAARLDAWLEVMEEQKPDGNGSIDPWLAELLSKVASLRGLCREASERAAAPLTTQPEKPKSESTEVITLEVLQAQDDKTSGAIIESLKGDSAFQELAGQDLADIISRDAEDAEKLQAGVEQAIKKGVLPGDLEPSAYEQVEVMGKSAEQVADEIMAKLPQGGCIVILVGLSGTGKGTTVEKIRQQMPMATTWSNGNCFRALTLLAATHCEQQGSEAFDPECLTPDNLAAWSQMLEFNKYDGKFDIRINGLGLDVRVSEVANTLLKQPKVSKNIPTIAKETQGEVVKFAGAAVRRMSDDGTVVLLEGREQTLNFIPSPYRFCLTMAEPSVIGARRAAQRIAALAVAHTAAGMDAPEAVRRGLAEAAALH